MSVVDSAMTREVLRMISKRSVDIAYLDVHVTHGVVYLRGRLEKLRGYHEDVNLEEELHVILKVLRQRPGIRDVCCEVDLSGPSLREREKQKVRRRTDYI